MAIIIYTSENCSYCAEATKLLDSKKLRYQWIDVTNDPAQRQLMIEKSNGLRTVPQIFIDNQHIGPAGAIQQKITVLNWSSVKF